MHTSYVGNHISLGDNILWPDFIGVYLKYKRIYLEVIDGNGKHYDLITSDYDVDLTKWNFVSLNFMNRCDGQGYADVCEYALVVNAHRQTFKQQDPRIYVDCGPNPVMNIGHKFDGYNSSFDFTGKITGLLIGRRTYLFNDTIVKFYRLTKDYIIDNQLVDGATKTVDFSQTNLFTINQNILSMFDIYPLQNNVLSLTNKRPIKFNIRRLSTLDKDRTFNFNSVSKKYSYVADGEELIYDFGFSDSGTIAMRAYTDVREDKQYFFEGKDDNGRFLGLYRNENNYVFVDVDGLTHSTGLRFENNGWHFVSLSFKESISSSNPRKYLDLRVLIDNKSWEISVASFEYSNLKFIIGRKYEEKQVSMTLGLYYTTYPFYGQIEMIATRPAYCEVSTLNTLRNELVGLTKVSEFDDFGMLKKVDRPFALSYGQEYLINKVASLHDNVAVVVNAGGGIDFRNWGQSVQAILMAWYPGQEGGKALAEIITGKLSPSGKLPVSIEEKWEDNPVYGNYYDNRNVPHKRVQYAEGVFVGYRGYDRNGKQPLYPFGYGLSYSSFEYSNLSVEKTGGSRVTVSFDIKNTGKMDAAEAAQVYVRDVECSVPRPLKELKGYDKVYLKKGETKRVRILLDEEAFAYYDVESHRFVVEKGTFEILAGPSSADLPLKATVVL